MTLSLGLSLSVMDVDAQAIHRDDMQLPKGSDFVKAYKVADCTVPFDISSEGQPFRIRWGMDTAWESATNVKRGIAFIGKDCIELARASFNPNWDLTSAGELSSSHKSILQQRLNDIALIGKHVEILFNDDPQDNVVASMYQTDANNWARLFDKTVEYAQQRGFRVAAIAPFNEPDYGWGQDYGKGAKVNFLNICKAVRSGDFPRLDTLRLCGANTLNCDQALPWYNYLKDYLDEGNTHQLAGSFDSYADFFAQVSSDGKVGTADELHNIMEAMVGVQYGMTQGIWWGFDGLARGEFCRASFGDRLSYAEDRTNWTAGSVYRNTLDGKYEAFVGTSERQANKSSYLFVSKDRDVYYDGYGPQREFLVQTPGGTGYQQGQTNAERVVNITFGEDVQPAPIDGTYILMNKASKMVMAPQNGGKSDGTALVQVKKVKQDYLEWLVQPVDSAHGGDFSYYMLRHKKSGRQADVWNWSLAAGGVVNLYNDSTKLGDEGDNELYWFEYAGDGCYYIHSKYSNLVLGVNSTSSGAQIVQQNKSSQAAAINRQLWKLLPADAACELTAPAAPQGLALSPRSASILLTWDAGTEEDLSGYTILRADKATETWNTIARDVKGTQYLDNTCRAGIDYIYKVKALDRSVNTSECSETVQGRTLDGRKKVLSLQFESTLQDETENHFDASIYGGEKYTTVSALRKVGDASLSLSDGSRYLQLPYALADGEEMTVCCWFKNSSSGNWARLFDFGNGTDAYMFFTLNSGSDSRFVMKNGGDEEVLSMKKMTSSQWTHYAVTIGKDRVTVYVNGEQVGESDAMHIRPSDIRPVMCYIGRSQFKADPMLKGYIDDFRIYNYSLSADDVAGIVDEVTDVENVYDRGGSTVRDLNVSDGIHNLAGQLVGADYKGIVIEKGQKYLRK